MVRKVDFEHVSQPSQMQICITCAANSSAESGASLYTRWAQRCTATASYASSVLSIKLGSTRPASRLIGSDGLEVKDDSIRLLYVNHKSGKT